MENNKTNVELKNEENEHISTSNALSDEQRVKVMSPSQLVFKRFIRNKLAVIGFVILAVMFLFSFVGPIFSPYKQAQQFYTTETQFKSMAMFSKVYQWSFDIEEGSEFTGAYGALSESQLKSAAGNIALSISIAGDKQYYAIKRGEYLFDIVTCERMATYNHNADGTLVRVTETPVDDLIYEAMKATVPAMYITDGIYTFEYNGVNYIAIETKTVDPANPAAVPQIALGTVKNECVATCLRMYPVNEGTQIPAALQNQLLRNYYATTKTPVVFEGKTYACSEVNPSTTEMRITCDGADYAMITGYVLAAPDGSFINADLMSKIAATALPAANANSDAAEMTIQDKDGKDVIYKITKNLDNYSAQTQPYDVKIETEVTLKMLTKAPPKEHILGTDKYAMDVATRLMYGGRVSLMVGFVVVFIEILIGIILGGIAGYFSGWVDVIIMRLIELFNCIPFYPMMMILGSLLDAYNVSSTARIFLLMVLLGVLGWPAIARLVRGQILSLREQDFIIATEACGIPVRRRIFRHLIPNVIPLLIVNATMSLGSIIITEATLSFLGLGIQYPAASWGSIINQTQSAYEIEQWTWIWVPTGILILLTVLGFNFVGDGLRDAFDPKMKR